MTMSWEMQHTVGKLRSTGVMVVVVAHDEVPENGNYKASNRRKMDRASPIL